MLNVFFYYADRKLSINHKIKLRRFIQDIFQKEEIKIKRINYIFCSDKYLLNINKIFLNHDYYTDVITFNLTNSKIPVEGEIYISTDRVIDNAFKLKIKKEEEFHRVIIHGALHLCGYQDKTTKELKLMRAKEKKYLSLFKKYK
ncbi:MAG TPA: rRNA maturation RNase YbeY [Chitinophagaceae bacterium]